MLGRVPVSDAPFQGLLEEQLIVDGVEHAAQGKDGHIHPGLPQLAPGHGVSLGGRRRLRGGQGRGGAAPGQGQTGQSDGSHELPARQVSIFPFTAHGNSLLLTRFTV